MTLVYYESDFAQNGQKISDTFEVSEIWFRLVRIRDWQSDYGIGENKKGILHLSCGQIQHAFMVF